jgi:tetratricopeptide (TPR) repeat protein
MAHRKDGSNRNETFGRLLAGAINSIAAYEGRTTPVVEEELGQPLHLAGKTIQRYKSGYLPPDHETVKVLAEAAVRRGFLDREWLVRFLHAARYPFADALLEQLRPSAPVRVRPPRIYQNLPAPPYNQFVMRSQAFAEVLEGLQLRSAMVLIHGLGGNGKTSLAHEVAARCLTDELSPARFDAVVWVSDKDRPGATNLSVVLDDIARTLDYPGFAQFAFDEKRWEVEQLLRQNRVLIVVDNFETVTDGALLTWLSRLPEPSKALITSREYSRGYRNSTIVVDLRGMDAVEAKAFVEQRLRILRVAPLVNDETQLESLIAATGGNPKAIAMTLGLAKQEHRPLQRLIEDLYAARGTLFDDLFERAWTLLDEAARHVLLSAVFFSTSAASAALAATANVQGFVFERAVERLTDLALLDVQQEGINSAAYYMVHPLVRAFAAKKSAEQIEFEQRARKRWLDWYVELASNVGFCWNDLGKLDILDAEQETAYTALTWACEHRMYTEALQLAKDIEYFYAVRGRLSRKLAINLCYAEAAQAEGNADLELHALASQVHILSMQGNVGAAEAYLPRLQALMSESRSFPHMPDAIIAIALYWIARGNIDAAQHMLEEALDNGDAVPIYGRVGYQRWLAVCHYSKGELTQAQAMLQDAFEVSLKHDYDLGVMFTQSKIAQIAFALGDYEGAEATLSESRTRSYRYHHRRDMADIQHTYARLHMVRGDLPAARAALTEAVDLFERLGMRRKLAEARTTLGELEARELAKGEV